MQASAGQLLSNFVGENAPIPFAYQVIRFSSLSALNDLHITRDL